MERTAPDVSGQLFLVVLVLVFWYAHMCDGCVHDGWNEPHQGVQEKEPGFFLNGLKSVGVNAPIIVFISASLKAVLCLAAEAERSESNSSTFCKKREAQNLHQSHMGINLLKPGKAGVAKVTNNSTQARRECVMKARRRQAGDTLS